MKTNFKNESFEDERDNYQRNTDSRDIFAERVRSNQMISKERSFI